MSGEVPRQVLNSEYLLVDTTRAWWGRSQGIYLNANVTSLKNRWLLLRGNNHSSDTVQFMQFTGLAYGFNYSKQHNNAFNLHKITKIRAKYGRFCQNARTYGHARINTSDFFTLLLFSYTSKAHNKHEAVARPELIQINFLLSFASTFFISTSSANYSWKQNREKDQTFG